MINGKKIGIVILNYKDSTTVQQFFLLIHNYKVIDHIVIVDNQSPDDSFRKLKSLTGRNIDVIQTDANKGYSYGNNFGINYLLNKYDVDILFISNPDVEFTEQFLIRIVEDMERYHAQAATGYMHTPMPLKMNPQINTYWREVLECTVFLKKVFTFKGKLVIPNQGIMQVEWIPGSLFAVDANIFKQIGGFDDSFFLYYEEQVLGEKFKKAGYKMIVDTDLAYRHNVSVSINKSLTKISQLRRLYKSKYHFYTKYKHINLLKRAIMKVAISYGLYVRLLRAKLF